LAGSLKNACTSMSPVPMMSSQITQDAPSLTPRTTRFNPLAPGILPDSIASLTRPARSFSSIAIRSLIRSLRLLWYPWRTRGSPHRLPEAGADGERPAASGASAARFTPFIACVISLWDVRARSSGRVQDVIRSDAHSARWRRHPRRAARSRRATTPCSLADRLPQPRRPECRRIGKTQWIRGGYLPVA